MRFLCAFVKIYYLYEENSLCYSIFVWQIIGIGNISVYQGNFVSSNPEDITLSLFVEGLLILHSLGYRLLQCKHNPAHLRTFWDNRFTLLLFINYYFKYVFFSVLYFLGNFSAGGWEALQVFDIKTLCFP